MIFWAVYLFVCFDPAWSGWQDNLSPRIYLQPRERYDYNVFRGNSTHDDHFSVVLRDGQSLLVGGRNVLYKLGVDDLKLEMSLEWTASEQDKSVCVVKGKSEDFCQNYVKVLKKYENDSGRYLVCGTNAYKPVCRDYVEDSGSYLMTNEVKGVGKCPYSPLHNSTAVLVGDRLYAGTTADYQGVDALIYRDPLRTLQHEATALNIPSFVGSFALDGFVYFFFREGAIEYMNCGKTVYSRVARICENDNGGTRALNNKWTSYLKARLNCSVPGNFPFYFDEIQDISRVIEGVYKGEEPSRLVYAVFSTPPNSIGGSAVCAFSIGDFNAAFNGLFKEQTKDNQNWLPLGAHRVPDPRPGTCMNDSKVDLTDANMNFIKKHPLMNTAVESFFPGPLLVRTGLDTGFTSIDVDAQVVSPEGATYDVIFVGTRSGHLLKSVNTISGVDGGPTSRPPVPVIIEEIEAVNGAVIKVQVVNDEKGSGHVIVVSSSEVRSYPLYRCDKATSCSQCVALQDPYCAWDLRDGVCRGASSWSKGSQKSYFQNVTGGHHSSCPHSDAALPTSNYPNKNKYNSGTVINSIEDKLLLEKVSNSNHEVGTRRDISPEKKVAPALFTLETLIITVSAGAVAALVLGFVTGYCCGRKCGKEESNVPYQDAEYEYFEQRQLPPRPLPGPALQPLLQQQQGDYKQQPEETLYAEPILINQIKPSNPLGTTLAYKPYPASGMSYAMTGPVNQTNKFNTISNIHKRGAQGHYGLARGALSEDRGGEGVPSHYERGGMVRGPVPHSSVYHMGTISRANKHNQDPAHQVVDSAYGTTRSVKKVYL